MGPRRRHHHRHTVDRRAARGAASGRNARAWPRCAGAAPRDPFGDFRADHCHVSDPAAGRARERRAAVGGARDGCGTCERSVAGAGRSVRNDRHSVRAAGRRRRAVTRPRNRVSLHSARCRPHPMQHHALHHARRAHAVDAAAAGNSAIDGNRHRTPRHRRDRSGNARPGICIRADAAGAVVSRATLVRRLHNVVDRRTAVHRRVSAGAARFGSDNPATARRLRHLSTLRHGIGRIERRCLGRGHAAAQSVRGWPFDDSGRGDDARRSALSRRRAWPWAHQRRVARFRFDETLRRRRRHDPAHA